MALAESRFVVRRFIGGLLFCAICGPFASFPERRFGCFAFGLRRLYGSAAFFPQGGAILSSPPCGAFGGGFLSAAQREQAATSAVAGRFVQHIPGDHKAARRQTYEKQNRIDGEILRAPFFPYTIPFAKAVNACGAQLEARAKRCMIRKKVA